MPISQSEATILAALLKSNRALTLEDHARRVIQQLRRETIRRISQSSNPQQVFNPAFVSLELAKAVGLPVSSASDPQSHPSATDDESLEASVDDLIRAFPLYTPLFGEQRLVVHSVLERLRQQGWLEQQPALPRCVDPQEFID